MCQFVDGAAAHNNNKFQPILRMEYKYYKYVLVICTIFYYFMSFKMEREEAQLS